MDFRDRIKKDFVILDGATGSNLQEKGMESGVCPEIWVTEHPDIFVDLQKAYIEAGSDALYTSTFTSTSIKLAEYGVEDRQAELIKNIVALTKRAIKESNTDKKIYILGDISMTGQQLEPVGNLPFEELVNVYKEQVSLLVKEGVDGFAVETMMSLSECRAAVIAIKEICDLPIIVTLTYEKDGRTLYGTSPETAMVVLQSMGVDAVGLNCSSGPKSMVENVNAMARVAKVPLIAKPNAGLPLLKDGKTVYDMDSDTFASEMMELVDAGVTILGGCCGSNPTYIKKVKQALQAKEFKGIEKKNIRALSNERKITEIDLDGNFMIIGERINPTGKKDLQAQLKEGKLDMVLDMAEQQVEKGAKILDVNMGMNGIDEKEMMLKAVKALTMSVDVPLSIDSSYVDVIEAALRIYPGRALINSISLETEKFEKLLPIAKKYGAMFILLPLSESGLPKDIDEKKQIINTILARAKELGMDENDIVVDGLVATIGANKNAAKEVFETVKYCKDELGLATACGLSNISFGLPERVFVNSAFLTMAIANGLTMAIANPSQTLLTNAALASDLLLNKKDADIEYINGVSSMSMGEAKKKGEESEDGHPLYMAVIKGKEGLSLEYAKKELEGGMAPGKIIDEYLIPAINRVGELFEQKKYFLPQLIASAEAMDKTIEYLEPFLQKERGDQKLETLVLATVKGDIHDIGKNLVVMMLKNYGYDVIDLGKDVEAQLILDTAKEKNAAVIGLSALMTTTMVEMKTLVEMAKEQGVKAKIIIGGAVVTQSYADEIGADGYSEDAREAVKLVNSLLGH